MIRRILVPLDGSPFSEHALPVAAALARRAGAELQVVQVHEIAAQIYPDGATLYDSTWDGILRTQEQEYLRGVAGRCMEATGVAPHTALLEGGVTVALATVAADLEVDLIVMTTHGRGGISRAWVGSVADALVRRAAVPVLLVRPRSEKLDWQAVPDFTNMLIPLDGSVLAEGVIEPALALGRLCDSRFTLLRAVLPVPFVIGPNAPARLPAVGDAGVAEARVRAEQYVAGVAAELRRRGVDVETATLFHGTPAIAILDYAATHGIGAIAMATRGRGGWSRIALGSVADKVMRGTMMPMLLFRPEVSAAGGDAFGAAEEAVGAA